MSAFKENNTNNALTFPKFGSKACITLGPRIVLKIKNAEEHISEFIHSKYQPFPKSEITKKDGTKIKIPDEQRNYLSFDYNEQNDKQHIEKYGDNTKNKNKNIETLNYYNELLEKNKEIVFENNKTGKNSDKSIAANYTCVDLLRDTNNCDDEEEEKTKPKYFRPSFLKSFALYYNGEKLDDKNNSIISKGIFPKLQPGEAPKRGEELKAHKNSLTFVLFWPQGSQEKKSVRFTELEERKGFSIDIIYREVETDENIKKPNQFTNEDLEDTETLKEFNSLYGEPKMLTISTIEEMEQYCKASTYYRVIYTVSELGVETGLATSKDKKKLGFKAFCKGIDIIYIHGKKNNVENTSKNSLIGKMYKKMAFDTNKKETKIEKKETNDEKSEKSVKSETSEESKKSDSSDEDEDEYEIEEVEVSESEEEEEIVVKKPTKSDKTKTK